MTERNDGQDAVDNSLLPEMREAARRTVELLARDLESSETGSLLAHGANESVAAELLVGLARLTRPNEPWRALLVQFGVATEEEAYDPTLTHDDVLAKVEEMKEERRKLGL